MALDKYNRMRDFKKTLEPKGIKGKRGNALRFVIQKHDASHLHYDFRLEMEGVMKSWAVPKGPSLDPRDKRLAMQVEDHPISYNTFEGTIPKGQYGGGEVIVWDNGTYHSAETDDPKESEKEFLKGLEKGTLTFVMEGKKLHGIFTLARFKGRDKEWILVKKNDEYAGEEDITVDNTSVLSRRTLIGRKEDPKKYEGAPGKNSAKKENKKARKPSKPKSSKTPARISPMLATLTDKPFSDPNWIYEIKWDGYRALANVHQGEVDLYSRNFNDFNDKFPAVVEKLKQIKETVIMDGEVVAYDEKGNVSFQALQNAEEAGVEFMIFDILFLEGEDLTHLPLMERKRILRNFLIRYPGLKESDYIVEEGEKFFKIAAQSNIEGVMAKHKESHYVSGRRTGQWLKIKHHNMEEMVVAGFTEPRGGRKNFGALILGRYEDPRQGGASKGKGVKKLKYAGHTGTGFTSESLKEMYKKLLPLVVEKSPFNKKVPVNAPTTWVKPVLVAQVKFAEWTKEGIVRQAVFLGLREDKDAKDVVAEKEIPAKEAIKENKEENKKDNKKNTALNPRGKSSHDLTNLDKIYFPKNKITKGDLIAYYEKIAPYILPYLKDRPQSLNRHPNGISKPSFFQKDFTAELPQFAETAKIRSESNDKDINYLVCQNKETLLYMANLGCIEINPWNSRIDKLDYPDYLIFDMDPKQSTWENLIKVTKKLKSVLDSAQLPSYVKTSGKSGLHIYVPLRAKYKFEDVRNFSHLVAQIIHKLLPDITSLERNPAKRRKKIYLDYLQNRFGQTTASVYSVRPTQEATVSTPLKWTEVTTKLDPKKFTIKNIHARLKKTGDMWKPVIKEAADLEKAILLLEKNIKT